jgi:hypothetical protein
LREEQLYLLGLYVGVASEMGVELRTGADWDRDGEIVDNGFDDFYHVEKVTVNSTGPFGPEYASTPGGK